MYIIWKIIFNFIIFMWDIVKWRFPTREEIRERINFKENRRKKQ